jgi:hypothetical protein
MKDSLKSNPAEGVGISVVLEINEEGEPQHYVYLINEREEVLKGCLVTSRGYGSHPYSEELIQTSILRHFLDDVQPKSSRKIEPIMEEVFGLNNEYWVSFWIDNVMYDKKYIFLPETIQETNFVTVPILEQKGVFIR